MGIKDKFWNLLGIEEYEEEFEEPPKAPSRQERRSQDRRVGLAPQESRGNSNVIPLQNRTVSALTSAFKMVVIEPTSFDECPKLVDNIKSKKPIIINLERIESDTARKIFDFLSGATYALNGNVHKVANNIFVFAPENVDITASVDHRGFAFDGDQQNHNPWKE